MFGASEMAFASGTWSTQKAEGCSKEWTYNPYGASSETHEIYSADTSNHSHYTITNAHAWVDQMTDCGPGGYGVYADHINMTVSFTVFGSNLQGCSISLPFGFSCSAGPSQETLTYDRTCGPNVYGCSATWSSLTLYAPSGGSLTRGVVMQTTTTLVRSDGHSDTYSTTAV
ncbi:hypothetical protein [Streptomyces sp. CA-111067]|uniref:hypothetical protein n=1 Tax=Streptomyces sp. CA-111067 TaxID=3240046 RepID=UPI003D9654E1